MVGHGVSPYEIWDRAQTGPRVDPKEYNFKIMPEIAAKLVKEHEIEIDRASIIPIDNSLADAIYRAGYELLLENGIYCSDTHRVIRITEEELKDGIKNAPAEITIGEGRDAVKVAQRRVGSSTRPVIECGGAANPCSEEIFIKAMQSYAQEPLVKVILPSNIPMIDGHVVEAHSPYEIKAAKCEAIMTRMACALAGRPGMGLHVPMTGVTSEARIAADAAHRPSDLHMISTASELKISLDCATVLADWLQKGNLIFQGYMPLFGGYLGGSIEKMAVLDVAGHLATFALLSGHMHNDGTIHPTWGCTTTRPIIQILAHVGVAIDRNTNLLTATMKYTKAGPGTEMIFTEIATQVIADVVSGRDFFTGVSASRGIEQDHVDGILGRAMAEVSIAATKLNVTQANEIVNILLAEYDNKEYYKTAATGKKFQECYDVMAIKPTDEHLEIYKKSMEKLEKKTGLQIL